jgi:predicted XRE-type DNA-binding protein
MSKTRTRKNGKHAAARDERVEDSSGNVFDDLGLADPEMRLAKARLAQQISRLIKAQGLTQQEAAEKLGIDQPKVSAILRGRLKDFATDRLMRFIIRLHQDVIISFSDPTDEKHPSVRVLVGT